MNNRKKFLRLYVSGLGESLFFLCVAIIIIGLVLCVVALSQTYPLLMAITSLILVVVVILPLCEVWRKWDK